jgi:hypothetical protein
MAGPCASLTPPRLLGSGLSDPDIETLGAIKQKYANRHRAYQYIAESKRWESNDRQKVRFCYRFNLTKGTDIATTFSIVKPTLQVFSSNLSPLVSGYGGLRTFV